MKIKEESVKSSFWDLIYIGIDKELISIDFENERITYYCSNEFTTSFKNPEEKVRASYFVELIEKYKYPKERISLEVTVPRRTPEDRADIIVFQDDELKSPYIVVECKKDGITDAQFKQAIEQAFGNANSIRSKFATVIAGTTRTAFDVLGFKPIEREKNVISDIPVKYGKVPKYRFIKGDKEKELKTVSREELIKALEKAHDTVWQGGKLAPTTAFDEVSKLLFCKLQDEKERTITKRGEYYKFQIGSHEKPEEVFNRIDSIYQFAKRKDSEVFKEDIKLSDKVVYSVVEHLQEINFSGTDLDTKGVAFERFMEDFFKGKMGQYFTPREIIRFAVRMIDINENQLILDPSCGSGGFILNAMDYIRELADAEYPEGGEKHYRMWHDFAKDNLFGIEINDQIARVCKMNMIIHDDGHSNVINTDALRDIEEINLINYKFYKEYFDVILTNPPFGATIKLSENPYLSNYELGKGRKVQKSEILFIERCIDFLKPDGKMAIILPDGILSNKSLQYVRDYIMKKSQILAVIGLPQFAFSHYGAGVKSSLLFLRKKKENEIEKNYNVFMAIADRIGYDATGKNDQVNELDDIIIEYRKFQSNPANYGGK